MVAPKLNYRLSSTKGSVSVPSSSSAAADKGQDLVYGEEYHMSCERLSEHGIVATPANACYQLVVGLLSELGEVQPLARVSWSGLNEQVGSMRVGLEVRVRQPFPHYERYRVLVKEVGSGVHSGINFA
jgi:hypothetical protein